MKKGSGSAIRYSTTVHYDMLYRAFHQTGAGHERIVRVAAPLKDIEALIGSFRKSLLFGLLLLPTAGLLLADFISLFKQAVSGSRAVFRRNRPWQLSAEFFSRRTAATKSPFWSVISTT